MLFTRDSKPVAIKVGIRLGVCNNPPADLLYCDIRRFPISTIQHPPIAKNVQRNRVKMG